MYIRRICAFVGTVRLLSFTMHRENNMNITSSELNCRFCIYVDCTNVYLNVWQGYTVLCCHFVLCSDSEGLVDSILL